MIHDVGPTTLFGRMFAFVLGILALAAAFFFSLILFAIILAGSLFFLAYVWWRSRRSISQGRVIDAESRREFD